MVEVWCGMEENRLDCVKVVLICVEMPKERAKKDE